MPARRSASDNQKNKIEPSKLPSVGSALQLLPVAPNEFQARWSLSQTLLEAGSHAAAPLSGESRLVLRVYALPTDPQPADYSSDWHDYAIDQREDSAFFTLPKPAPRINAVIGLVNRSGRFSPLVRGDAITLPPLPAPPVQRQTNGPGRDVPAGKALAYHASPTSAVSAGPANPVPQAQVTGPAKAPTAISAELKLTKNHPQQ